MHPKGIASISLQSWFSFVFLKNAHENGVIWNTFGASQLVTRPTRTDAVWFLLMHIFKYTKGWMTFKRFGQRARLSVNKKDMFFWSLSAIVQPSLLLHFQHKIKNIILFSTEARKSYRFESEQELGRQQVTFFLSLFQWSGYCDRWWQCLSSSVTTSFWRLRARGGTARVSEANSGLGCRSPHPDTLSVHQGPHHHHPQLS